MNKFNLLFCVLWSGFAVAAPQGNAGQQLFDSHSCSACHAASRGSIGPAVREIAERYKGKKVVAELAGRIRSGSQGRWGTTPHPPYEAMTPQEAIQLAQWMLSRK